MPGFNLTNHYQIPDSASGFELAPKKSWIGVILPEQSENLVTNPSFELGTTGFYPFASTLTRSTDHVKWGFYGLKVAPLAGFAPSVYYDSITTYINLWYTFSADLFSTRPGEWFRVYFADAGGNQVGSYRRFQATGFWQRVWVNYYETANSSRRLYITREFSATSTSPFYVDGVQVEQKDHPTTYLDGDQSGYLVGQTAYYWTGIAHGSTSVRIADTGSGGREMNLLDIGMRLIAIVGLGMMPFNLVATPIATGGAYYQRSIPTARQFTLAGAITAENHTQLQRVREELINTFNPYRTATHQPLLFKYHKVDEAGVEMDVLNIPAVYESGLEVQDTNPYQEKIALTFRQFLPFIQSDSGVVSEGLIENMFLPSDIKHGGILNEAGILEFPNNFNDTLGTLETLYVLHPGQATDISGNRMYEMYVGGNFTSTISGVTGTGIVRYSRIYNQWSFLGRGVNSGGSVRSIREVSGASVYVGGSFTGGVNGDGSSVTAGNIALWNEAFLTWQAVGTGVGANGIVYAIAKHPITNEIYVGGAFTQIDGVARAGIAKWSGAAWSSLGTGIAGGIATIRSLEFDAAGNLYAGGNFTTAGGVTVNNIAKWDGANWTAMGGTPGTDGTVQAIAIDTNSNVYIGGSFTTAGGAAAGCFAKWNGSAWSSNSTLNATVLDISIDTVNNLAYISGDFTTDNNNAYGCTAVLNLTTLKWYSYGSYYDITSGKFDPITKKLWVAGSYGSIGGKAFGEVARYRASLNKWERIGAIQASSSRWVNDIKQHPISGDIYFGGTFTSIGGVSATCLARWNGSAFVSVTTITGAGTPDVTSMVFAPNGDMYISGNFSNVGGVAVNAIAKYTVSTGAWSALGTGLSGVATDMVIDSNGNLYVIGQFATAGGVTVNNVAKWDGANWTAMGTTGLAGSGLTYGVALAVDNSNNIYAGGLFETAGGISAYNVAKWNGSAWSALAGLANAASYGANLPVRNLAIDPNTNYIFASGEFAMPYPSSTPTFSNAAYWDGVTWRAIESFPNIGGFYDETHGISDYLGLMYFHKNDGDIHKKPSSQNKVSVTLRVGESNEASFLSKALDFYTTKKQIGVSAIPAEPELWQGIYISSSIAFPKMYISGPGSLHQIINYATNETIQFNGLTLLDGETAILDITQYGMSFERNDGVSLIGYISGASHMSLKSGYNKIIAHMNGTGSNTVFLVASKQNDVGIR